MTDLAEIRSRVVATLSDVLGTEVAPDAKRVDLPTWDSLKHVELVFALEDEFDDEFLSDQIPSLNSVDAIVAAVVTF